MIPAACIILPSIMTVKLCANPFKITPIENSNELCYATSQNYNGPYHFGGTIISNGDVGNHGRRGEDRTNQTANVMEVWQCIKGQWYIFHHRQTHSGTFADRHARTGKDRGDGSIAQVECTSMGLP